MSTNTPYVSSLNSVIKAISQEYLNYLNSYFGDVKGMAIGVEDNADSDLRRIRETHKEGSTPENKEHLPYLIVSVSGIKGMTNHPEIEKYKITNRYSTVPTSVSWAGGAVTVNAPGHRFTTGENVDVSEFTPAGYNGNFPVTVTGVNTFTYPLASNPGATTTTGKITLARNNSSVEKTLFRLVDLDLKARTYVTNYAQALVLVEYILCTNLRAFQYTVRNPHIDDDFTGRVSVSEPSVTKVTDLESKGVVYKVEVELSSNAVLTIPLSEQKLILTPIADFLNQEPVAGLERTTLDPNGQPVVTPL